jgi:superfamily II DNA or RNA helicase
LIRGGYKIYAVASDDSIGNNINGEKVSRREFLNRLKEDGRNLSQKLLILHYDILAEGIDVPGITGIMPLRTLGKAKFLQTFGRSARLDVDDRTRIELGEIKPSDLDEMNKPYAWVIVPTIIHEDADDKEHIGNLITELRDYGFNPSQDIVSTDTKNGLPTVDGPEGLNEVKSKCPNIGKFIEKVEADYEAEYIASLSDEERVRYILIKENPSLEGMI